MELADVTDSKSVGSDTVPVRVRPPAPYKRYIFRTGECILFYFKLLSFDTFFHEFV